MIWVHEPGEVGHIYLFSYWGYIQIPVAIGYVTCVPTAKYFKVSMSVHDVLSRHSTPFQKSIYVVLIGHSCT